MDREDSRTQSIRSVAQRYLTGQGGVIGDESEPVPYPDTSVWVERGWLTRQVSTTLRLMDLTIGTVELGIMILDFIQLQYQIIPFLNQ